MAAEGLGCFREARLGTEDYREGGIWVADLAGGLAEVLSHLHHERDVALMCVCRRPEGCHRTVLIEAIRDRLPDLVVLPR